MVEVPSISRTVPEGKCEWMCPKKEFQFRKKNNLIHTLEKNKAGKIDARLCVKEFRRSAAGEKLSNLTDLRPSRVLISTIKYLIENIAFCQGKSPTAIYNFVFDRLRSVRQDCVIQQIWFSDPLSAMEILAKCSRYYMYARYKQLTGNLSIDAHINDTHLADCLSSLAEIYFESSVRDDIADSKLHMEMCGVYLLHNHHRPHTLLDFLSRMPASWRRDVTLSKVIALLLANINQHHYAVVSLSRQIADTCGDLMKLPIALMLAETRARFLCCLAHSHNSKTADFPLEVLQRWLHLASLSDTGAYCRAHHLTLTDNSGVRFSKLAFKQNENIYFSSCPVRQQIEQISPDRMSGVILGS